MAKIETRETHLLPVQLIWPLHILRIPHIQCKLPEGLHLSYLIDYLHLLQQHERQASQLAAVEAFEWLEVVECAERRTHDYLKLHSMRCRWDWYLCSLLEDSELLDRQIPLAAQTWDSAKEEMRNMEIIRLLKCIGILKKIDDDVNFLCLDM